jgi:hypothetical protein
LQKSINEPFPRPLPLKNKGRGEHPAQHAIPYIDKINNGLIFKILNGCNPSLIF